MASVKVREVARRLSLSPGTVSKALQGRAGQVSLDTARYVLEDCLASGYLTKAEVDRTLYKMKFQSSKKKIFCMSCYQGVWGYNAIFSSVSDYLQDHGQYTSYFAIKDKWSMGIFPFETAGNLIMLGRIPPDTLPALKDSGLPIILVDNWIEGEMVSTVNSDNLQAMTRAVNVLTGLGHKRIAFMRYCEENGRAYNLSQRQAGYIVGMANAGLNYEGLIFQKLNDHGHFYSPEVHDQVVADVRELAQEVLESKPRPTAVVAANDFAAHILRQVAREKGLKLPEDLSIIGYDGQHHTPGAGLYFEPVSTQVVDYREMGREAVALAVELIINPEIPSRHLQVPTRYEDAGTVAPPAG